MHFFEIQNRRYAQFERLQSQPGLTHAFCTRPQDVSARTDARQAERGARRRQMAADLGLNADALHHCVQVHETKLAVIDAPGPGRPLEGFDAVLTNQPDTPLMTFSADCPLVLAFDPLRHVVGLAHASWRCTVAALARKLVETMQIRFGCDLRDLRAGVGPSAGPCCYEVKQDVFEAAASLPNRPRLFIERAGRMFFDLWEANRQQLLAIGLRPEHIETADVCTLCRNDLFYSFRREGAGCGHFGLLAAIARNNLQTGPCATAL